MIYGDVNCKTGYFTVEEYIRNLYDMYQTTYSRKFITFESLVRYMQKILGFSNEQAESIIANN